MMIKENNVSSTRLDRAEILEAFRGRLESVIERSGLSRSAFAARVGADRSTLSQLLIAQGSRLPRAETLVGVAEFAGVSVDWLLGLSQEGQVGTDVMRESVESVTDSPADARLAAWQAEATGYKIRYVPATLPDLLKTETVIRYEYAERERIQPEGRIEQAEARLAYSRRPETDLEVCSAWQDVEAFAHGHGIWSKLPREARVEQLRVMATLADELYPTLRWFLFDGLRRSSAPYSIFGPLRAAVYVGDMYLVFNATEHIRSLTRHFDGLIRAAVMQPPDVLGYLGRLHDELRGAGDGAGR